MVRIRLHGENKHLQRTRQVATFLSQGEYTELKDLCDYLGVKPSQYIRHLVIPAMRKKMNQLDI